MGLRIQSHSIELATIGTMLNGEGPTFFNEYEIYGDRHFLRAGAPVEPAEYRTPLLATLSGAILTKAAWAESRAAKRRARCLH